jgi:hypothetical protein
VSELLGARDGDLLLAQALAGALEDAHQAELQLSNDALCLAERCARQADRIEQLLDSLAAELVARIEAAA